MSNQGASPAETGLSSFGSSPQAVSPLRASIPSATLDLRSYVSGRLAAIQRHIEPLRAEEEELTRVLRALDASPDRRKRVAGYRPGGVTILDAILAALDEAGRPVRVQEIFERVQQIYGSPLDRASVAPQASRLKRLGKVIHKDGQWSLASAIEARRAETGTGSVHESAVAKPDAQGEASNA